MQGQVMTEDLGQIPRRSEDMTKPLKRAPAIYFILFKKHMLNGDEFVLMDPNQTLLLGN